MTINIFNEDFENILQLTFQLGYTYVYHAVYVYDVPNSSDWPCSPATRQCMQLVVAAEWPLYNGSSTNWTSTLSGWRVSINAAKNTVFVFCRHRRFHLDCT